VLIKNLNKMLLLDNEDRHDGIVGYKCRLCLRSFYRSQQPLVVRRVMCACLRCMSVLYCCATCKVDDSREHRFSCFMHPGWECEESTKQRLEKERIAGVVQKPPLEVDIREIETAEDPSGDSKSGDECDYLTLDDCATLPPEAAEQAGAGEAAEQEDEPKTATADGDTATADGDTDEF
jgi:hypothetical protein